MEADSIFHNLFSDVIFDFEMIYHQMFEALQQNVAYHLKPGPVHILRYFGSNSLHHAPIGLVLDSNESWKRQL